MCVLETLNVTARRYIRKRGHLPTRIHFTGFTPSQSSTEVVAQLYGPVENSTKWAFVNIVLHEEDLAIQQSTYIQERIDEAIHKLQDLIGDPFDNWVKEVRAEHERERR